MYILCAKAYTVCMHKEYAAIVHKIRIVHGVSLGMSKRGVDRLQIVPTRTSIHSIEQSAQSTHIYIHSHIQKTMCGHGVYVAVCLLCGRLARPEWQRVTCGLMPNADHSSRRTTVSAAAAAASGSSSTLNINRTNKRKMMYTLGTRSRTSASLCSTG